MPTIDTAKGPAAYTDTGGDGPPALFVHGVATSGLLWHNVIDQVRDGHRCLTVDLPLHGATPPAADYSLGALADFVIAFAQAYGLSDIDLVANDTGGAVAQIVAARHPELLRSFTLTNSDTLGNLPPKAFLPTVLLARAGLLAPLTRRLAGDPRRARRMLYGSGYQDTDRLPLEKVRAWQEPVMTNGGRELQRFIAGLRPDDLEAAAPRLAQLTVPTLLVWGTGDRFFGVEHAYRLRDLIPGATDVVEVPGARLFFPDERPGDLAEPLVTFWESF